MNYESEKDQLDFLDWGCLHHHLVSHHDAGVKSMNWQEINETWRQLLRLTPISFEAVREAEAQVRSQLYPPGIERKPVPERRSEAGTGEGLGG